MVLTSSTEQILPSSSRSWIDFGNLLSECPASGYLAYSLEGIESLLANAPVSDQLRLTLQDILM